MTTASLLLLFAPSGQGGAGMSAFIIQIGLFIGIFYFLLISSARSSTSRTIRSRSAAAKRSS